jgi:hypothetical protein
MLQNFKTVPLSEFYAATTSRVRTSAVSAKVKFLRAVKYRNMKTYIDVELHATML